MSRLAEVARAMAIRHVVPRRSVGRICVLATWLICSSACGVAATDCPVRREGASAAEPIRQDLFGEVMHLVRSAVEEASPNAPIEFREEEVQAYNSAYKSGFALGLRGGARPAHGVDQGSARASGWNAGQRAGFRIWYEMQRLLSSTNEQQKKK